MAGRVAVIGAGSWGTTVASLVSSNTPTVLWARSPELAESLRIDHCNPSYLPDVTLPDGLEATADLARAVDGAQLVIMAVPSHGFRAVLSDLAKSVTAGTPVISLTKGLEQGSHQRMTQVVADLLPESPAGVLTGPNLASEVIGGQPAASVVALADQHLSEWVQELLISPSFRVYTNIDVVGCEIAGALKNVLAIASGICDGLGFGDNTRAALITRGLAEMARLGVELGGAVTTFGGLAGVGDLVATCTSLKSRNRTLGEALWRGRSLTDIIAEMRMVAEGVKTARPMVDLGASYDVEMPIVAQVADLIDGIRSPGEAMAQLMERPAAKEFPGSWSKSSKPTSLSTKPPRSTEPTSRNTDSIS
ncbi:MAG TPA: NAD(P)H-dependent glycerol-3-phosphate dehydrogenase, partial [Acidimicrobiales bacterium]|nr:NAD(P)H-dependent glycerol-3-phosphate dehydrogenase [Acidimicrobiales bacterium]